MRNLLIAALFCFSFIFSSVAFTSDVKQESSKKSDSQIKVPQIELKKDTSAAPCQSTQEQILKQLAEKKKIESSTGSKTSGLPGLGTPGCSVK